MNSFRTTLKRLTVLGTVFVLALAFTACDSFVSDIDEPVDEAGADEFADPAEAEFLITGIQAQWADTHAGVTELSDNLSDEFRFGINADATFPTFAQLDAGFPSRINNSIQGGLNNVHEYRFMADDLLRLIEEGEDFDLDADPTTPSEAEARAMAEAHGANARYYLATFFGDPEDPRRGGSTIDESPFIPSPELYAEVDEKYGNAVAQAEAEGDDLLRRQIQSARARAALYAGTHDFQDGGGFQGDEALEAAAQYAQEGLQEGESWEVLYDLNISNDYHFSAGAGRLQLAVQDGNINQLATRAPNPRQSYRVADEETGELVARNHVETVVNNPEELSRIPLTIVNPEGSVVGGFGVSPDLGVENFGADGLSTAFDDWQPDGEANPTIGGNAILEFGQGKYGQQTDMEFISWQELFLIRAELDLRGFDEVGDAATLINDVRASFGLEAIDEGDVDLERLAIERDRTLFATGNRLPDQRRLESVEWHLQDEVGGNQTWQWLRLEQSETEPNPNF